MWRGEITAANAAEVWVQVESDLTAMAGREDRVPIDLSEVRFIDSTGVGLLARTKREGEKRGVTVTELVRRAVAIERTKAPAEGSPRWGQLVVSMPSFNAATVRC